MSDNTEINSQAGGDVIATDELTSQNGAGVSGVKVQRMKVGYGEDGALQDVSRAYPLPVQMEELLTLVRTQNALLRCVCHQLSFLNSPRIECSDLSVFMQDGSWPR